MKTNTLCHATNLKASEFLQPDQPRWRFVLSGSERSYQGEITQSDLLGEHLNNRIAFHVQPEGPA
jgi:hypothetical protein